MFRVTGLKILGRIGTHIFFLEENNILCILKGISPFKMHTIIYFFRKPEKILGFTSKFRSGWVTLNTGFFFIWPELYLCKGKAILNIFFKNPPGGLQG